MRGLAVLTVVFVFASTALFVGPASAQGSASLSGMVCLAPYGAPAGYSNTSKDLSCTYSVGLPDAQVALTKSGTLPAPAPPPVGPATATAKTDANGFYSFSSLAAGDYSFTVTRQGFKTASGTVTVGSGSHQDVMLAGDVVDAKGLVSGPDGAVAKATVNLCCDETGQHSGTTGSDGRYTVSVKAGYWSIDVAASGYQSASQYLLVDGSAVDFKLEKIPPQDGRIAGTVVDQDGKPVADARVALSNYGGGCYDCCYDCSSYDSTSTGSSSPGYGAPMSARPYYSGENVTFTDAQGRFSMGAYSGGNSLTISKDGYAYQSRSVDVAPSGTTTVDVELLKYPEKTAKVTGKIVDAKTGKGLAYAYVNLQSPQFGIYECSQPAASPSASPTPTYSSSMSYTSAPAKGIAEPYPYYAPGCAITTNRDGTFTGMVSPGYAILSVYVDNYASCSESTDADGTFTRSCGPEYYTWSSSKVLPANASTTFDIRLRSRPAPDAEVSGYIIDSETGQAIPRATISFSNQDTYGYGSATTDGDGSYSLRLRSGYHTVSVWAEGHLRWEGVLDVPKGDSPFDVKVEPGTESYGGCCYYPMAAGSYGYAEDSKSSGSMALSATSGPQAGGLDSAQTGGGSGNQAEQYQDLGGGLGPYDASKRESQLEKGSSGSPGLGVFAMLAAIGAVFALRRRLA